MGRIWRALKLGMKSLLLHKLRSGLTVLGIVFGVAAVISMLAIAEGSSREAQERIRALGATNIIVKSSKPSDEAQATGGRPARILNYGIKYDDYERILQGKPYLPLLSTLERTGAFPADTSQAWIQSALQDLVALEYDGGTLYDVHSLAKRTRAFRTATR